ncbi:MgtC/SapB family protein [Extibacter muris]|uniref:MgtC/SapB family protein n=1 Tax=Extibacter muris TaxID=1796622 RepID=UPI001D07E0BC|nr:MgtC/SapB family protein [Extibacter muris]MCB6200515.1 MgtC/SapB family protein [Extibacter muris]MCQ4663923.1 MgtC/SapB family protein [Extibacter muris]MCQ4692013.1 MgtC/SapB family protein [Extibacter muris]
MSAAVLMQLEYFLRVLGAAACGAVIGYERESHMKSAGIRTHAIVALASSLMMVLSKYGFYDILAREHIGLDPSRIAAGVVTAVGFLGAGVIFNRKMNVIGITTAAGIWATVGIGMAFGAGMYALSVASSLFIVFLQFLFHTRFLYGRNAIMEQITIQVDSKEEIKELLGGIFSSSKIKISNINARRIDDTTLEIKLYVKFPESYDIYEIFTLLKNNPQIKSIDI